MPQPGRQRKMLSLLPAGAYFYSREQRVKRLLAAGLLTYTDNMYL